MKRHLCIGVGLACLAFPDSIPSFSQPLSGPQQCAAFNALADQHSQRAQGMLKEIETETQTMKPEDIPRFVEDRTNTASAETTLANLARDAYRKCLTDYLAGGSAQPDAAAPAVQEAPLQEAPAQQGAPQPVQQAPAKKAKPAQQAPRPAQQQRVQRQPQTQEQQPPRLFVPGGLIDLGIGIGIGRALRERQQ